MLRSTLLLESLKMIYHAHFHSILTYGLVFWGNYACSVRVFRRQKRIIRIIMDARPGSSCRAFFKTLHILPVASQYIYSIAVNSLPLESRNSSCNDRRFKVVLKSFLLTQSFYTLYEYFDYKPCNTII
jgi:hypothetical protein